MALSEHIKNTYLILKNGRKDVTILLVMALLMEQLITIKKYKSILIMNLIKNWKMNKKHVTN